MRFSGPFGRVRTSEGTLLFVGESCLSEDLDYNALVDEKARQKKAQLANKIEHKH